MEKIPFNNFIKAKQVRVIDEQGKQLGIMNVFDAIDLAKLRGLDLIQVTEKIDPPVCKIGNYGKYLYTLQKKERKTKQVQTELKEIRLGFNISIHDIEIKAKQAEKFLKDGNKVKINIILRGREKIMIDLAQKKIFLLLETIKKSIAAKIERELKKEPKGFSIIIAKQ